MPRSIAGSFPGVALKIISFCHKNVESGQNKKVLVSWSKLALFVLTELNIFGDALIKF